MTIVITGPESTGKSTLAAFLANHYQGVVIPEFARDYIEGLHRPYNYQDIVIVARKQIEDLKLNQQNGKGLLFLDTYLIITKVWFEVVFKSAPDWIIEEIRNSKIDLYLLCAPDIPWIADSVRENGGEMRNWLFKEYERNLKQFNLPYKIVSGIGDKRYNCALNLVDLLISN